MAGFTDETLTSMEDMFTVCDHILEEEMSKEDLDSLEERIGSLCRQTEDYRDYLRDQESNSRLELSREMAAALLAEDRRIRELVEKDFPSGDRSESADVNVGALYVEYLTGRARQSVREALIGAMILKTFSRRAEAVGKTAGYEQ